jgi:hypothetical protein
VRISASINVGFLGNSLMECDAMLIPILILGCLAVSLRCQVNAALVNVVCLANAPPSTRWALGDLGGVHMWVAAPRGFVR